MKSKIRLIVFDLDKTLIKNSSWQRLNYAFGVTKEQDKNMVSDYLKGKLPYVSWIQRLLRLYLKNAQPSKKEVVSVLKRYKYKKGAKETIKYLQKKGYHIGIITGSINLLVETVAKELGIPKKLALSNNTFVFDSKSKLKKINTIADDPEAKLLMLEKLCKDLKITAAHCAPVGDGDNDKSLFLKTKHGITFKNSQIKKLAWKTISKLDDLKKIF